MRRPATVYYDIGAGQESSFRRAHVKQAFRDFFHFAPTTDGKFGNELLVQFGIVEDGNIHLGGARAGADAVDGNAFGCEFERECFCETEQAGFAGGIGGAARKRDMAHDAGEIDDTTIALAAHVWNERAAHEEGADEIGIYDGSPLVVSELGDIFADVDAGVVDEDVNLFELSDDLLLDAADIRFTGDIAREDFGGNIEFAGFGRDDIQGVCVATDQREVSTLIGEREREGFAESFASAGDDGNAVFQ